MAIFNSFLYVHQRLKPSDFTTALAPAQVFEQRAVLRRLLPGGRPTVDGPPDAADALLGLLSWLGRDRYLGGSRRGEGFSKMKRWKNMVSDPDVMMIQIV